MDLAELLIMMLSHLEIILQVPQGGEESPACCGRGRAECSREVVGVLVEQNVCLLDIF
jgi:hypothetical protein